jgi:hypothetical protein
VDDRKNLSDHEILSTANQQHPKLNFGNLQKRSCFIDSDNWYALFAAKGTPTPELDRVNQAVRRTLNNAEVRARLQASGAEPSPSTPAELAALLSRDSAKWARLITTKNIKPN